MCNYIVSCMQTTTYGEQALTKPDKDLDIKQNQNHENLHSVQSRAENCKVD